MWRVTGKVSVIMLWDNMIRILNSSIVEASVAGSAVWLRLARADEVAEVLRHLGCLICLTKSGVAKAEYVSSTVMKPSASNVAAFIT